MLNWIRGFYVGFALLPAVTLARQSEKAITDGDQPERAAETTVMNRPGPSALTSLTRPGFTPLEAGQSRVSNLLLFDHTLQKELGLNEDQVRKLEVLVSNHRKAAQLTKMKWRSAKGEERSTFQRELDEAVEHLERALLNVLDREQRKRIIQIVIQINGMDALALPIVSDRLYLAPTQRVRIAKILAIRNANQAVLKTKLQEAFAARAHQIQGDRIARFSSARRDPVYLQAKERYERASEENIAWAVRAIDRTLTRTQERRFERLAGAPFDFEASEEDPEEGSSSDSEEPKTDTGEIEPDPESQQNPTTGKNNKPRDET